MCVSVVVGMDVGVGVCVGMGGGVGVGLGVDVSVKSGATKGYRVASNTGVERTVPGAEKTSELNERPPATWPTVWFGRSVSPPRRKGILRRPPRYFDFSPNYAAVISSLRTFFDSSFGSLMVSTPSLKDDSALSKSTISGSRSARK